MEMGPGRKERGDVTERCRKIIVLEMEKAEEMTKEGGGW